MSTKDWVLLLVPLIGNGVIFYVVQQILLSRYKRKQEKRAYQDKVIERFMTQLETFVSTLHGLRKAYVDPIDSVPFSTVWNPTSEQMQLLVNYYECHQIVLEKMKPTYTLICNQWKEMVCFVAEYKFTKGSMDQEFINRFHAQCNTMHGFIKQCLLECEKQFLKV